MLRSRAVVVWPGAGQAFGVLVAGVLHAQRLGLLVHELDEVLDRAAHALGQRHGGVVARLHDHPLDQVVHRHLHLGVDEHARARHLPGALADRQRLLQVDLLGAERVEHQVGRHQLGQRCRLDRRCRCRAPASIWLARDVQQQVAAGRDFGRLRHLGRGGEAEKGQQRRQQRLHPTSSHARVSGTEVANHQALQERQLSVKEMLAPGNHRNGK